MSVGSGAKAGWPVVIDRYAVYEPIAAGGMATVHLGRLLGPKGFSRTVAIKMLHKHFASDPDFPRMLLDEARIAARIRHPNVVPTLEVVASGDELFLVMEYVAGEALARLMRTVSLRRERVPLDVASALVAGVLHGLHAAHEATDESGAPLHVVHRDVSPQNVLVGSDGVARLLDFGVAKAAGRFHVTTDGTLRGKLPYMAPEQLRGEEVSAQTDIYASGVLLWELVTGSPLFSADNEAALMSRILAASVRPPSEVLARVGARRGPWDLARLDAVVMRALSTDPSDRFATAQDMATALEAVVRPAPAREIGEWVRSVAAEVLDARARMVAEIESSAPRRPGAVYAAPMHRSAQTLPLATEWTRAMGSAPAYDREAASQEVHGPRRRVAIGGALAGAALLALLATMLALPLRAHRAAPAAPPVPATQTPPPEPSSALAVTASAEPVSSAEPPPTSPSPVASSAPAPHPVAPRAKAASAACSPPYWFDAQGTKHYKTNCPLN